jgi:drug/metabolite transporter (DMT)-like permease
MNTNTSKWGLLAALGSVFFFSTYTIFGSFLLKNLSPETLIAFTSTLSVLLLFLGYGLFTEYKILKGYTKKTILILILISFLSAVIAPLLFLKGLEKTMATNAMIIGKLEPVLVGIICVLWLHESFNKFQAIGSVLMMIGVVYVATQGFSIGFSLENSGDLLVMAGAFTGAISTSIFKKHIHHVKPEIVVLMRNSIGAFTLLFIIPLLFDFSHSTENLLNQEVLTLLFGFAIFTIILAQFLWYKALDMVEASKLSTFSMMGPLFGIAMAVIFLGEEISGYHVFGFILVLIGLTITLHHEQKHEHHEKHLRIKHFFHH